MEQLRSADRRKHHIIYKTTCLITGRYYIGMHSTDDLGDGYIGSGKLLWRSIKKYGKDNHRMEVLEHHESRELLRARERELVTFELLKEDLCMNLTIGGHGGWVKTTSSETRQKQRETNRAFWSSEAGLQLRARYRTIKRPFPEASKPLAAERARDRMTRMKADGSWQAVIEKNRASHLGKTLSAEHRAALGEANRRYKLEHGKKTFSNQARANIAGSLIGNERNKKAWTLIDLATNEELLINNLSKWCQARGFTAPTHYVKSNGKNVYIIKEAYEKFLAGKDERNAQRRAKRSITIR